MTTTSIAANLLTETVLSFSQAARRLPPFRGSRPVASATIWRWVSEGVRLPDGTRLKLEAVRLGGRWVTSLEALGRFSDKQTQAQSTQIPLSGHEPESLRTPAQREKASQRASAELEALGM